MEKRSIDKIINLDESVFEKKLNTMAKMDDLTENCINQIFDKIQPIEISTQERNQFYKTVKKASDRKVLLEARKNTPSSDLPFGRYLQRIRDNSGLSEIDISNFLNKDSSYIEGIENGRVNPLDLAANEIADIMQLFRLTFSELKTAITAFLDFIPAKKGRITAMARSSGKIACDKKGTKFEFARDAALQAILKKKSPASPRKAEIDPDYLEAIKDILEQRNEKNLLV